MLHLAAAAPGGHVAAHRKTLLVVSFTDHSRDPRVNRQIRLLKDTYAITAAGTGAPGVDGVDFAPLTRPAASALAKGIAAAQLLARAFETFYWRRRLVIDALRRVPDVRFDGVIANDVETLPLALKLSRGAPVILDAHEYSPMEFEDRFLFRLLLQKYNHYLCRQYLPNASGMSTVCRGIADQYAGAFGAKPIIVPNAGDYQELSPRPVDQSGRVVRMVHHGAAIPSRKLELMIDLIRQLQPRFELSFFLTGCEQYIKLLKRRAASDPRIRFCQPVPMRELPRVTNEYDIGLFLLPPTNFNYRYALPNKFFEFIQARLAIAIGPSEEMAPLVRQHHLGVVADDFTPASLAARLNALTPADIDRYKQNAHRAAPLFSAESAWKPFVSMVESLVA